MCGFHLSFPELNKTFILFNSNFLLICVYLLTTPYENCIIDIRIVRCDMFSYKVGDKIDSFIGRPDGCVFDLDDSGAVMFVFFANPTEHEIAQFSGNFELRFTKLQNIIMFCNKIGKLNWMDSPYTPHLSPNLHQLPIPKDNEGIGLLLSLVDTTTGCIKTLRQLGLSTGFSRELLSAVANCSEQSFNRSEYVRTLNSIYARYDTKALVKISKTCCKFKR